MHMISLLMKSRSLVILKSPEECVNMGGFKFLLFVGPRNISNTRDIRV